MTLDHIVELQQCYYVNVNVLMYQTRAMTVDVEARLRRKLRGRGRRFETEAAGPLARQRQAEKLPRDKSAGLRSDYITAV